MCDSCDYEDYLVKLSDMIENDNYSYALDFLEGVYEWVESHEHITDAQKEGVDNVLERTRIKD